MLHQQKIGPHLHERLYQGLGDKDLPGISYYNYYCQQLRINHQPCASQTHRVLSWPAWKSFMHYFLDHIVEENVAQPLFSKDSGMYRMFLNNEAKTWLVVHDIFVLQLIALAHKNGLCLLLPNFALSDITLVAYHWPYWKYLYHRNQ